MLPARQGAPCSLSTCAELRDEAASRTPAAQVIEENKALLKAKYDEAKALGADVNSSRAKINKLKAHIEQIRVERAMQGLSSEAGAVEVSDPEEEQYKGTIEAEKERYKRSFNRLKELKTEIEHLQLMLEQSRKRLQKDFDGWFLLLERQGHGAPQPPGYPAPGNPLAGQEYAQHALQHAYPPSAPSGAPSQPRAAPGGGGGGPAQPQLTGNAEVDAEILAFYKARESLLQSQQRSS